VRKGDDLTTFIVLKEKKIQSLNLPEPLGPLWPVTGHLYLFFFFLFRFKRDPEARIKLEEQFQRELEAVKVSNVYINHNLWY
jgi:hypothetical protein